MFNLEEELLTYNHGVVDGMISIISYLFLTEQIRKNSDAVFIHNHLIFPLSELVIISALKINIKNQFIKQLGEKEGLVRAYKIFRVIYQHGTHAMELTAQGLTLLEKLFIRLTEKNHDKLLPVIH
ncbi:hypothetical protein PT276_02700 [Orbaceae bacterium ESL0721]|nr:hypothetical protein [Orbaceae bacterium ESL0721]